MSTLGDDYYRFDEETYGLIGRRKGKVYRLGDKVRVGVLRVDVEAREIDLFVVAAPEPRRKRAGIKGTRRRRR